MITLLTGENSFEIDRALQRMVTEFEGQAEKIDGSELELRQIPDLLMGLSLFAEKRLVIIKNLSDNKTVWTDFDQWLGRVSDDISLVLVEPKPDKRTKVYKWLEANATVHELGNWGQYDDPKAIKWCQATAKEFGFTLSSGDAKYLVERGGVNQWQLYHSLEKLALAGEINKEVIDAQVEPSRSENAFNLLVAVLSGDKKQLATSLEYLQQTEDPYRLFALLSTQVIQLTAAGLTEKPPKEIATDLGISPYVIGKLAPVARKIEVTKLRNVLELFARTDRQLKSSAVDPWILIERALLGTL